MYVERKMRLYIREQNDAIAQALERGGGTIAIYSRLRKELNRWLDPSLVQQEVKWIETGVCHIHIPLDLARRTLVYTDASGGAGGIYIDGLKIDEPFYWSKKMAPKDIYMKEAFAILVMLRKKGSLLQNRRLLVKCDNQIVCSAIYNGSKKSSELNDLILAIYDLARKHNIDLRANYVDTKNQLADEASRTFDYNESKISDKAFSELIAKWGMAPTVDAFAAEENARQRTYVSRFHDDGAWRVDFFQITKSPPFRMDVRTAVQEAVREWRNALTDLAEFLATRRRDPRALSPHVWSLIEAKVVRLLRAYGALGEAIQRITDNPLIHFFPPVPAENPPRFRPPSNEDAFLLARPWITRAHGSPTWSIDANASSSEDEE
jgi:hypothetical protein